MRVAVVTVGDELLLGDVVDTNGAWLGRRLAAAGMPVRWSASASDDRAEIVDTIADALRRADVVLVSGGLGPTSDDVTRSALAELAGVPLRRDPGCEASVREAYAARGLVANELSLAQADLPEGALVLRNPVGSAPGLGIESVSGGLMLALPGVPSELRALVDGTVLELLRRRAGGSPAYAMRMLRVALLGESAVAGRLEALERELTGGPVRVAYLASAGEVLVRFSCSAPTADVAGSVVRQAAARAEALLEDSVTGYDDETLPATVLRLLEERGQSLATAESLTGGGMSTALTDVPGASSVFVGGSVVYSTAAKATELGVDTSLLAVKGPVHAEVAQAMAQGARRRWGSDWAVSCTGVAGPGPSDGHPAGTVHVAVAGPAADQVCSLQLPGTRDVVRGLTVIHGLDLLRRMLLGPVQSA